MKKSSRDIAVEILREWQPGMILPELRLGQRTDDHRFIMELTCGVVRWCGTLDWMIKQLVPRTPVPALHPVLQIGLYQLFMMDNVAPYAVVNETVETARKTGGQKAAGFVNAVLRNATRKSDEIKRKLSAAPDYIRYSHPEALVKRWQIRFGEEKTRSLLEWNNQRPQVTLCLHSGSMQDFLKKLTAAGVEGRKHPAEPERCVLLSGEFAIKELPGYAEGLFSIQSPATLSAVDLMEVRPGQRILDACAAPGGKTMLLARQTGTKGEVVAADFAANRLKRLKENLNRMRLNNIRVLTADATGQRDRKLAEEGAFDRILLDIPCMNTGVLRGKPDARWRFSPDRLKECTQLQKAILNYTAQMLCPGGKLVYSTCSLETEENESMIKDWVDHNHAFHINKMIQRFPPATATDGAFACSLTRTSG